MPAFERAAIRRDQEGHVVQLNHLDAPFTLQDALEGPTEARAARFAAEAEAGAAPRLTARALADLYLQQAMPHYNLNENIAAFAVSEPTDQLIFAEETSLLGNAAVSYQQRHDGIPVWESGMVVQINQLDERSMEVIGSQSTFEHDLDVAPLDADPPYAADKINGLALRRLFDLSSGDSVEITNPPQTYIYRYHPHRREQCAGTGPSEEGVEALRLPPLDERIRAGQGYVVTAVEFAVKSSKGGRSNWLALIDVNTGSVLHLRSLLGCALATMPAEESTDPGAASGASEALSFSVVFFDIGGTLGQPRFSPSGELDAIDVFPDVPEILKELNEQGARIGIISDPGNLSTSLITSLLSQAGILGFFETALLVFGRKDSPEIFEAAAGAAGVPGSQCVFVGEDSGERDFASAAGFSVVGTPAGVIGVVAPDASLAWVYLVDPISKAGSSAVRPNGPSQDLDRMRDLVSLRGLERPLPGQNQRLKGEHVEIVHIEGPNPPIPTSPPPGDFRFSVASDDFGAACAYHNCDRLFRLLKDFGIVGTQFQQYFGNTTFPVRVDHRFHYWNGLSFVSNVVNASAPGSSLSRRSDGFRFALAARNTSVCMSADWRVTLHEFGHAIMWGRVGSPNFHFAHSAGDALAAILTDPDSKAPRNQTFPWVNIGRSHLRPVGQFAWHGTRYRPFDGSTSNNVNPLEAIDAAGYVAEEILSSTLFRIYQAAGGDAADVATKRLAARYVAFLIFKAVGLMTVSNNPEQPEGFADLLMQADLGTFRQEGKDVRIGALRKVIRWAFELQGAYRPTPPPGPGGTRQPGATNQVGRPPEVDVFINDGRDGHYHWSADPLHSTDVWNRQSADGGTVHQTPVSDRANFLYVRVSNRGLENADDVKVQAYQSRLSSAQVWPTDWQPLATAELPAAAVPSGGAIVVGPFSWVPSSQQPTVLVAASAPGDAHLLSRFGAANPIDNVRIVPVDNNVAQRTMTTTTHGQDAIAAL